MIIEKIKYFETVGSITKKERITRAISEAIRLEDLKHGDVLPSVNELSKNLGYARETVVKSYGQLKERGLINSKQGLGYFISSNESQQVLNIALVMYAFQTFQQTFYNTIQQELGELYNIDVYFHLNNERMYQNILNSIKGQYGMYVVAPVQSKTSLALLKEFDEQKLLIIDRFQDLGASVSSITQEFEKSLTTVFKKLKSRFQDFEKTILFYRNDTDYPTEIEKVFIQFFSTNNLPFEIHKEYKTDLLQSNFAYFTISDIDLWNLLKDALKNNLKIGKDIGILSHNDTPVKEIIEGGITTYTTDFEEMANKSVAFIKNRKKVKKIIPSVLKKRNSL